MGPLFPGWRRPDGLDDAFDDASELESTNDPVTSSQALTEFL